MQLAVEVEIGCEHFGNLRGDTIGDASLVGRGKERGPDRAAAHAHLRGERRRLDHRQQLAGDAFDTQAGELRAELLGVDGRVACDQFT